MQQLYADIFGNSYSKEQLKEVCDNYPFFTAAHLALLQAYGQTELPQPYLGRTAVHFNNPYLLSFQLSGATLEKPVFKTPPHHATASEDDVLIFEPLHTTDYFASQGIKLSEAILQNDKLGRQLKSFTEWLKTMKKVHPVNNDATLPPVDVTVEKMAENSNREEEIITEAMAEVYENQGKYTKAREVYHKLSLQNPSKSSYFANKLNQLKDK